MKFKEFYHDLDKEVHGIEIINKLYKSDKKAYKDTYYGHMYCPECKISKLEFHPTAKTPYLKTMEKFPHYNECSYRYELASKKKVIDYYTDKNNSDDINKKLKGCIDLLLEGTGVVISTISRGEKGARKGAKDIFTFEDYGNRLRIRRKNITRKLDELEDYNNPILFYGIVQLKWEEKYKETGVRYLMLYGENKKIPLASIRINSKVYEYLDEDIKNILEKQNYNIAFMSEMNRKDIFNNCTLVYSKHLVIEKR